MPLCAQVVVQVHACSVNPTDWKQRKGTLSTMCPLSLPCVLGIDLAGKVMRAGEEAAQAFSEGDEIFGAGRGARKLEKTVLCICTPVPIVRLCAVCSFPFSIHQNRCNKVR